MNDSFFVCCSQPMCDLQGIVQSLAHRDRPAPQPLPQRLSLQQLGHYIRRAFTCSNVEDRQNIGMIQRSGCQGLLLKTAQPVGVQRKRLRQHLDRNFTLETGVAGAIHLAHASRAQRRDNFIGTESRARS